MDKAVVVRRHKGGARRWIKYEALQSTRVHRTLWTGVLYVVAIIVILATVAKLT